MTIQADQVATKASFYRCRRSLNNRFVYNQAASRHQNKMHRNSGGRIMPFAPLRLLVAAACLIVCASVRAHQDDAGEGSPPTMDCEHPPKEAVRVLPEPVGEWAQLDCRSSGQILVQKEGWVWRYPGSWTEQVYVPAWMAGDSAAVGGGRYFKAASVVRLEGAAAARLHDRFAKELIAYEVHAGGEDRPKPSVVYTLLAVNDLGYPMQLSFLYRSDADIWGVACSGQCKSENVFHIYRRQP
jgi:hypothetical protein